MALFSKIQDPLYTIMSVTKVRVSTENILFLTCDRNDAHRLVLDLFRRHYTFKRFLVQKETSTIKAIKHKSIIKCIIKKVFKTNL